MPTARATRRRPSTTRPGTRPTCRAAAASLTLSPPAATGCSTASRSNAAAVAQMKPTARPSDAPLAQSGDRFGIIPHGAIARRSMFRERYGLGQKGDCKIQGEVVRLDRGFVGLAGLVVASALTIGGAVAQTDNSGRYPNWKGQWYRNNPVQWDPTKPQGRAQQPPLTPEYQAVWEKSLARQEAGGGDDNAVVSCLPPGVPRAMIVYEPMEVIILPETTYMLLSYFSETRRIFTDGRDWPKEIEPSFVGYSLGRWEDTDGDGQHDTLVVETRAFKGP